MNSITTKQNSDECIRLLKAQRVLYSKAKSVQLTFDLIAVIIALAIPIIYIVEPSYKTIAGIIGSVISIIALLIDRYQKKITKKAASVQEIFDRIVFQLKEGKLSGIDKISSETIIKLAKKYTKNDVSNWYSKNIDSSIPQKIAVLLCQKTNLNWDVNLKKKYKNLVYIIITVYFGLFIVALSIEFSSTKFFFYNLLLLLTGGSAFIKYSYNTINEKIEMIKEKEAANLEIDNMLDTYRKKGIEPTIVDLEAIQKIIFNSRKKAVKVPDFFYYFYKSKQETEMDDVAFTIIKEKIKKQS